MAPAPAGRASGNSPGSRRGRTLGAAPGESELALGGKRALATAATCDLLEAACPASLGASGEPASVQPQLPPGRDRSHRNHRSRAARAAQLDPDPGRAGTAVNAQSRRAKAARKRILGPLPRGRARSVPGQAADGGLFCGQLAARGRNSRFPVPAFTGIKII